MVSWYDGQPVLGIDPFVADFPHDEAGLPVLSISVGNGSRVYDVDPPWGRAPRRCTRT